MTTETKHDEVNPAHYKSADGSQVIDVIELYGLDFHTGNAVKYILRAGKKAHAPAVTDLKKAIWYLERKIKTLSPEKESSTTFPLAAAKPSAKGSITGGLSK